MKPLTLSILAATVLLTGCEPSRPDLAPIGTDANGKTIIVQAPKRFTLNRVATYNDDSAFTSKRSIYILHDKETEKDYIGISGVGISELGEHSVGKSTAPDER